MHDVNDTENKFKRFKKYVVSSAIGLDHLVMLNIKNKHFSGGGGGGSGTSMTRVHKMVPHTWHWDFCLINPWF